MNDTNMNPHLLLMINSLALSYSRKMDSRGKTVNRNDLVVFCSHYRLFLKEEYLQVWDDTMQHWMGEYARMLGVEDN